VLFPELNIVNSAEMNIVVQVSLLYLSYVLLGRCPGAVSLDHTVVLSLISNLQTAFHNGHTNLHSPPAVYKFSCFTTSLPATVVVVTLDYGHSTWGEIKSTCYFDLHNFYNQGS
jgi:hypothetical protein